VNDTETRLRSALHDLADEVAPAPLLERLQRNHRSAVRRRRLALAAVAAAVIAALVTGTLALQRLDQPSIIEPIVRPPKVFRLSPATSVAPGRSVMAVTLARPNLAVPDGEVEDPLYLLPAAGGAAIRVPGSDRVPYSWSRELSADGTRLIRSNTSYDDARLEVVELQTGRSDDLGGRNGYCPQLSADNATVAAYSQSDVHIIDVRSGASRSLYPVTVPQDFPCGGLGWSPDGRHLVVRIESGSVVIDRRGKVRLDLPQSYAVNSSMSWSPDGSRLLMYDRRAGGYDVLSTDDGATVVMHRPAGAQRPLGWAGSRVVWLAGQPGDYRLLTTDERGQEARTWMRFDIGDRPIAAITWSQDISGVGTE